MSTIARQLSHAAPQRMAARALAVRWEISPRALLASRGAAILNGHAARLRSCALVVRVADGAANAELETVLTSGERCVLALAPAASARRSSGLGVETIEAEEMVVLVVRDDRLLYARTPLLDHALGLPGGVCDAPTLA